MMLARLALAAMLYAAASGFAQPVALVTDLSGTATALGGAQAALGILAEIPADSQVRLEGAGTLTVLYYESGEEFSFRGPALIAFGRGGAKVLEGAAAQVRTQAAAPARRVVLKPGGVTSATFVMRGGTASAELRSRAESLRPGPGAPLSERVAYAVWLEQAQMRDEARRYWKALAAERPEAARLRGLAEE